MRALEENQGILEMRSLGAWAELSFEKEELVEDIQGLFMWPQYLFGIKVIK